MSQELTSQVPSPMLCTQVTGSVPFLLGETVLMKKEWGSLCLISKKVGLSELCQKWHELDGEAPADCGP